MQAKSIKETSSPKTQTILTEYIAGILKTAKTIPGKSTPLLFFDKIY
jgi:hypothetical protein